MPLSRRAAAGWITAVAAGSMASPAPAQLLPPDGSIRFSRYIAVRERQIPGYETPGIPLGSFTLSPALEVVGNHTDNVFALKAPRNADSFVRISPSAQLNSNWARRSLNLSADAALDRFADRSSENVDALNLSAYATQDLGDDLRIRAIGRFRTDRESRESQNAFALTRRPVKYNSVSGGIGASKRFSKLVLAVEGGIERLNYDDAVLQSGAVLDQDYRDGTVRQLRGRIDYVQTPSLAYFAQVTRGTSSYSRPSSLGVRRGARTVEALAGARFELPILARGEIGLGYIQSTYRDGRFRRFSGFAIDSRVTFFPTQLTNVTVNAVRSVNDAGTPESSSYVALVGGVQIDHELLRSLILGLGAQYERDRYNGLDRKDRRLALTASADYRLNRSLTLRTAFDRLDLSSRGTARYKSFVRNRVSVGVGVRI